MIEDFIFLSKLYEDIYFWLTNNTPGEHRSKNYFQQKDKKVWNIIKNKFIELEAKNELSNIEKEFLACKYVGKSYRKIPYNKRKKGQVYLINCYQSCSKTLNGLDEVSLYGDSVLIELYSSDNSYSIDLIKLLSFINKHDFIQYKNDFERHYLNFNNLDRYTKEEEVIVVLSEENIKSIKLKLEKGLICPIGKNEWYRKSL